MTIKYEPMAEHDPYDVCVCAQLRKAARVLTQRYDAALRPSGLKVTQFSILRVLDKSSKISMTALSERLVLDRTSLTRNLKPLERDGFVQIKTGEDSRLRIVQLTARGLETLRRAEPLWRDLQQEILNQLDPAQINNLHSGLKDLSLAAQN